MDQRDGCFRIRHSTPTTPETQTNWVEFILYWIKQGAFLLLMLLVIYSLLSA
jgi:hypothetical protein